MATRLAFAGFAALMIGALALWMLSGERGSRSETGGPRDASRATAERPPVPLESAERVAPDTAERETIGADAPVSDDANAPADAQITENWPGTCSLFGRLLDEDGRAVQVPAVWLKDEGGERHDVELGASRYRAVGLHPGRWWIESEGGIYLSVRERVDLPRSDAAVEVDLIFFPKLIVVVNLLASTGGSFWEGLSETELLYGIELDVVATRELVHSHEEIDRENVASFRAAERKGRELADPMLGLLEVEEQPPLFASLLLGTQVLSVQTLEPGMSELTFVVDPLAVIELLVTLRFRVLDSTGAPTDEAMVMIEGGRMSSIGKLLADGVFEREGLRPGACEVVITAPGHSMIRRSVELVPGVVDLGDLRLGTAQSLRGRIVGPDGDTLRSTGNDTFHEVHLEFVRRDGTGAFVVDPGVTLGIPLSGEFEFPLEPGEYLIRARGDRWMSKILVVEVPGGPVEIAVHPPSTLVLKLDSGDWEGWGFTLVDDRENPVEAGRLEGTAPRRLHLPPGAYVLRLTDAGGVPRQEVPFTLGREELILNLTL